MSDRATTETVLWGWLKRARYAFLRDLHMNRIENLVGKGTPDVEGCLTIEQFWIELKCSDRPKRPTTNVKVKFRPYQPEWHKARRKAGGRVFVLVQVGSGKKDARRYLVSSVYLSLLKDGITEECMCELALCDPKATPTEVVRTAAGP